MGLGSSEGWFAVFDRSRPGGYFVGTNYVPILTWEGRCVAGDQAIVGIVAVDRDGYELPIPDAAPNVTGFLRYEKR